LTMATPQQIYDGIQSVHDRQSFVHHLLTGALGWPIPDGIDDIGEISFEWSGDDLQADGLDDRLVDGRVYQIRPLADDQPWGIFLLEFKNDDVFLKNRGLTGPLRKVLRGVVQKRRGGRGDLPAWERENLLFICTDKHYHNFRFAYFKAPKETEKNAPLALFGWNHGDTDIRTLCTHNLPHLAWNHDTPDYAKWRLAFSIEKVTKDFYREYADAFAKVETIIQQSNTLAKNDLRLFTQTLFNRLMFLRFIEKKGWLTFDGQTNYLAALYNAGGIGRTSFYASRLCPLFFEALAIEGKQQSAAVGQVPFLNGGLFEKSELDDKVSDIDNAAFAPILGPDGLFYRYNFTVEESTPLDIEVAVDPEMLGKVFEELVTGRHESGSYYTPRPIVAFMCREAIKAYLAEKTTADANAIEALVDEHRIADGLTEQHADEILFYLETLKAVDPACGSGAYLLGLLQELIDIRRTLQNQQLRSDPQFLYKLKLRLISGCLYGVDIDEFATNIAKLRLWLSLSVESDTPQPLPNLDFKIETGDSVLGPCAAITDTADALMMSALRDRAQKLVLKKDQYMQAHGDEKTQLYNDIKAEEAAIAKETSTAVGKGVMVWHIHFAEVFVSSRRKTELDQWKNRDIKVELYEPGGFDIVLANPPYIRQELIKDLKPRLKDVFKDTYVGTADLYTYFYTRAVELLAPGGVLSFISSNKWFRANYGKKLRAYIAGNCRIHSITDFGELPVFETAATFPMVFVAQKTTRSVQTVFTQVKTLNTPYPDVKAIIQKVGTVLPSDAIDEENWNLTNVEILNFLNHIEKKGVPLGSLKNIKMFNGVKTGLNNVFVLSKEVKDSLLESDPSLIKIIFKFLDGDDVRKYYTKKAEKWVLYIKWSDSINNIVLHRYLEQFKSNLLNRDGVKNNGPCPWFALSRPRPESFSLFMQPKIIYPLIAKESRFTIDKDNTIPSNSVYCVWHPDLLFILGLLNSKVIWSYLKNKCSVLGDQDKRGRLQLTTSVLETVPIPRASDQDKQTIASLVQKCLDAHGQNCQAWEHQIDTLVTRLYGLSNRL